MNHSLKEELHFQYTLENIVIIKTKGTNNGTMVCQRSWGTTTFTGKMHKTGRYQPIINCRFELSVPSCRVKSRKVGFRECQILEC
jgi:hypothetical protein